MSEQVRVRVVGTKAVSLGHHVVYPGEVWRVSPGVLAAAERMYPGAFERMEGPPPQPSPYEGEGEQPPPRPSPVSGEGVQEELLERMIPEGTIRGIGRKWAARLAEVGIRSVEDLAALDDAGAAALMERLGGVPTLEQLLEWVGQARQRVK